jgi:ankyrin repeat protein
MDHGALVNAADSTGALPLHNAAIGGYADMINLLLDRGAKVNARDQDSGATPLILAASLGRVNAVEALLKRGADTSLRDNKGQTALDRARQTDSINTVQLLEQRRP